MVRINAVELWKALIFPYINIEIKIAFSVFDGMKVKFLNGLTYL